MGACAAVVDTVACMGTKTSRMGREKSKRQKGKDRQAAETEERNGTLFFKKKEKNVNKKLTLVKLMDVKRAKREWAQAHLGTWVEAFKFLKSSSCLGLGAWHHGRRIRRGLESFHQKGGGGRGRGWKSSN